MSESGPSPFLFYIEPTNEQAEAVFRQGISGSVTMLNLLRFRETADYTEHPELTPTEPITGRQAYDIYARHTMPFLTSEGGSMRFLGEGGRYFIGPPDERWDLVMLIQHESLQAFLAMATNEGYMAGIGHRSAALEDSRLLPIVEQSRT